MVRLHDRFHHHHQLPLLLLLTQLLELVSSIFSLYVYLDVQLRCKVQSLHLKSTQFVEIVAISPIGAPSFRSWADMVHMINP